MPIIRARAASITFVQFCFLCARAVTKHSNSTAYGMLEVVRIVALRLNVLTPAAIYMTVDQFC